MFIWANKWRVLFLLCCLFLLCDGWSTRRRKPLRRFSQRFRRRSQAEKSWRNTREIVAPEISSKRFTDEGKRIYEGDMVLEKQQVRNAKSGRRRRKAVGDLRQLWPGGHVKYVIGPAAEPDRDVILEAIDHWQENTCITFEELPGHLDAPHLVFRSLTGCHSNVGMSTENPQQGQTISLGVGCNRMGIAAHEIGHSLGFYHEHLRPDRDDYVQLYPENAKNDMADSFDLVPDVKYYGVPYDYDSLMHYTLDVFTANKKNTIVPKDFSKTFKTGQRQGLSFYDLKLANAVYNCSDDCTDEIACDNEGFLDKSCNCICPPEFEGVYCQFPIPLDEAEECGGVITEETSIYTPNYPYNYPADITCVWEIESDPGVQIHIIFTDFSLEFIENDDRRCYFDIVELRLGPDMYDGEKYCGDELKGQEKVSAENKMVVLFHSKLSTNTGFMAMIQFKPAIDGL